MRESLKSKGNKPSINKRLYFKTLALTLSWINKDRIPKKRKEKKSESIMTIKLSFCTTVYYFGCETGSNQTQMNPKTPHYL